MNALFEVLKTLFEAARPWSVVEPWEEAIRVRFGRYYKHLKPGIYFQLPFFDTYYTRDVKPRVVNLPNQTVTTRDGKIITLSGAMAYEVQDLLKTYLEVHDHEESMINLAMGLLAEFVATHDAPACTLEAVQNQTSIALRREAKKWGLHVKHLYLTDLATVKVIRLLQDSMYKNVGSRDGA